MTVNYLSAASLTQHVSAIADGIGPRPAGSRAEMQARQYVRHALKDAGVEIMVDVQRFSVPETWGYAALTHTAVGVLSNLLPGKLRKAGALLTLFSAYRLMQFMSGGRSPFAGVAADEDSANLIVRIPAKGRARHKVVLMAHLDTNRHRISASPTVRPYFRMFTTAGIVLGFANAIAQWFGWNWLRKPTALALTAALPLLLLDEGGPFVAGANDNASGVACLIGLGAALNHEPLENTEVWLAFTGAEESGCHGIHHLLDAHRVELANAYFIDFERVGAGDIAYVTQYGSMSHLGGYQPDAESLELAIRAARNHTGLMVRGASVAMTDEVGALHSRGFRGITLTGVDADDEPIRWAQLDDTSQHIEPAKLETAARFALAMVQTLDESP